MPVYTAFDGHRYYVSWAAHRQTQLERRLDSILPGSPRGPGHRRPLTFEERMYLLISDLEREIRWIVIAARRARTPAARDRLFREAHSKRMQIRRLREALRQHQDWRDRHNNPFGGNFRDPPPPPPVYA